MMQLTFRFEDQYGAEHTAVAKSHQPSRMLDESRELLVYDPHNPSDASLLGELPCQPRVGRDGNFEATTGRLPSAAYVLLPTVSVFTALKYLASFI